MVSLSNEYGWGKFLGPRLLRVYPESASCPSPQKLECLDVIGMCVGEEDGLELEASQGRKDLLGVEGSIHQDGFPRSLLLHDIDVIVVRPHPDSNDLPCILAPHHIDTHGEQGSSGRVPLTLITSGISLLKALGARGSPIAHLFFSLPTSGLGAAPGTWIPGPLVSPGPFPVPWRLCLPS